jgi:hypothetical protein
LIDARSSRIDALSRPFGEGACCRVVIQRRPARSRNVGHRKGRT